MKKKYYGEVDFWKLIFCLIILIFHGNDTFSGGSTLKLFPSGGLAVDFFLLVSGYFMMVSIDSARKRYDGVEGHSICLETASFLRHKLQGMLPMYVMTMVLSFGVWFLVSAIFDGVNLGTLLEKSSMTIWNLLLLYSSGIKYVSVNGAVWYIASMLFAMMLLYPLCRKWRNFYQCIAVPVIVWLLLGYMSQVNGHLRNPMTYLPIGLTSGVCRAILEIALGSVVYQGAAFLRRWRLTKLSRWLLAAVELGCFGLVILIIQKGEWGNYQLDFVALFLLVVALTIVFSNQSVLADCFRSEKWRFCGAISLPIYLCQIAVRDLLKACNRSWGLPFLQMEALYVGTCLVLSLVLMWVEVWLKSFWSKHRENILGLFVK